MRFVIRGVLDEEVAAAWDQMRGLRRYRELAPTTGPPRKTRNGAEALVGAKEPLAIIFGEAFHIFEAAGNPRPVAVESVTKTVFFDDDRGRSGTAVARG
jgi:hypothetical protein